LAVLYSEGGGAGPSIRILNQALVDADCDWIIVCPCGFTIEDTKKEQHLLSSKPWWYALQILPARAAKALCQHDNLMPLFWFMKLRMVL
jgi:hypothetical protein